MRNNPEFVRNLWLELTPHRLIAVPAVIAALVFLGVLVSDEGYGKTLGLWAVFGCAGFLGLWGARLAAGSVADEAANRTWDGQRLSALTPWEMTWGKLAGSTSVAWYGGLLCLAVSVSASAGSSSARRLATSAAALVAGALLCQGGALLAALIELRRGRASSQRNRGAGVMVFAFLLFWVVGASGFSEKAASETMIWLGIQFPTAEFLLASVALFAAWAVAGAWRLMREELQMRAPPLAWLLFTVFVMVYVSGFWSGNSKPAAPLHVAATDLVAVRLVIAYLSGLALLYCAAIFESKDPVVFRRLVARWRGGGATAAFDVLPCWLATVPLVLLVGAAAAASSATLGPATPGLLGRPAVFVASCFGFAVRDIALLLVFNLGRNPRRADAAALFYWIILYGVVPTILRQLDIRDTLFLFYPTDRGAAAIVAPALQAAAVLLLLRARWRRAVSGAPA